jgi:hypothetical protein
MASTSANHMNINFHHSTGNVYIAGRDMHNWNNMRTTGMSRISILFISDWRSRYTLPTIDRVIECSPGPAAINDAPIDLIAAHFTGRDKELNMIDGVLRTSHDQSPNRCAVYGMPGLGKTQLSLRYAKLQFDLGRYSHVFWIQATTVEKLNQGFAKILDLIRHIDRCHQEQSAKLTSARLWLEGPDKDDVNWLIVFDNVDRTTLDFLRMHLPRQNARGSILFTTRTCDVAEALVVGRQNCTLGLGALDVPTAVELFFQDASVNTDILDHTLVINAEEIVECVGRLPLAVAQAASFMKQSQKNVEEILALYKGEQKMDVSVVLNKWKGLRLNL